MRLRVYLRIEKLIILLLTRQLPILQLPQEDFGTRNPPALNLILQDVLLVVELGKFRLETFFVAQLVRGREPKIAGD